MNADAAMLPPACPAKCRRSKAKRCRCGCAGRQHGKQQVDFGSASPGLLDQLADRLNATRVPSPETGGAR